MYPLLLFVLFWSTSFACSIYNLRRVTVSEHVRAARRGTCTFHLSGYSWSNNFLPIWANFLCRYCRHTPNRKKETGQKSFQSFELHNCVRMSRKGGIKMEMRRYCEQESLVFPFCTTEASFGRHSLFCFSKNTKCCEDKTLTNGE